MSRPCHVLRVFTRGDEGGNHLGVVNDVTGLDAERMQRIATDLGFSETIFVDWIDPGSHPRVRIFTPADELPFAGHPLVGAAWVMSALGPGGSGRLTTDVGPVEYAVADDEVEVEARIAIDSLDPDGVAQLAVRAGLPEPVSITRLSLPKEYCLAEYGDFSSVAHLRPDFEVLSATFGFLAYARSGDRVIARFFAPGTGVPEDPATGSAAVALAHACRLAGEDSGSVTIDQGDEIGHPSRIRLRWSPDSTVIGGSVRRDEVRLLT